MIGLAGGGIRGKTDDMEVVSLDYIIRLCRKTRDTRLSCLMSLLYLTARRISEVLHLKKKDLVWTERFLSFKTQILKRPDQPTQTIRIPLNSPSVKPFIPFIQAHTRKLLDNDHLFHGRLKNKRKPIDRSTVWRQLNKLDPAINAHWFRHQRISHLSKTMSALDLQKFIKWKGLNIAIHYVHTEEMLRKLEEA